MTYVARRKSAKGRGKNDQHQHDKNADIANTADDANRHNFANEQRIKELSQRRGPYGRDLDGIR